MRRGLEAREARLARGLLAPALATVLLVGFLPLLGTFWESLHQHDLRMPWLGRPFTGLHNYAEAAQAPRFRGALAHTAFFAAISVALELGLGLVLALGLHRAVRGQAWRRLIVLLPWAIPSVVAALVWRFMFEAESGVVNALLLKAHLIRAPVVWFAHPLLAWVPIILADVWKMTPFVALLLLAGRQNIDETLYEAARMDGASAWQQFRQVTLPLLAPALLVALVFRTLDAFRVFDLVYVLTGGGPGTATEPLSLYTFSALLQDLRFGYGSALAMMVFFVSFLLALLYIKLLGASVTGARE
jgi:ABC-type sugar transport system permease subunit